MKKLLMAAALALACTACSFGVPTDPPVSASGQPVTAMAEAAADKVVITGTQALIFAALAHQSVGTAAAVLMERGVIKGELKAQIKALDRQVIAALRAGAGAQDKAVKAREAAKAFQLLDRLGALAGIKVPKI